MSDADMIAGSVDDPAGFALIFDRHYAAISGYLDRRVGRALADELTAETFVRAFAARKGYDVAYRDARPWLYGIATNLLRKHARAEKRRRQAYGRAAEPDQTGGGPTALKRERTRRRSDPLWPPPWPACKLAIETRCCCWR